MTPDLPLPDLPLAPDTGSGCVHPAVTTSCSNGWCTIPKGCFSMGSPTAEICREPQYYGKETQHKVTLTHKFLIRSPR